MVAMVRKAGRARRRRIGGTRKSKLESTIDLGETEEKKNYERNEIIWKENHGRIGLNRPCIDYVSSFDLFLLNWYYFLLPA